MKTINSYLKLYLQRLEQDKVPDLSKMENHWDDFRNTIFISKPTTRLNSILKYKKILVGACFLLLFSILWILYMGKIIKNDIKPPFSEEEKHQNSKVKIVALDTLPMGRKVDTIISAKTPVNKPIRISQRKVSSAPSDTISRKKAKMRLARPKQNHPERETATLIIDSLN